MPIGLARISIAIGSAALLPAQATLLQLRGDVAPERLGRAIAFAGDVDRDGHTDLVVGSELDSLAGGWAGVVRVLSGRHGELLFERRGAPGDRLGAAVAGAGDVDGDGHADVLVGAPYADAANAVDAGAALVLSGADGHLIWQLDGPLPFAGMGSAVAGAGDVDADGRDDVVVGMPMVGSRTGSVEVHSGRHGGLLWSWSGARTEDLFGWSVAGIGDVDADGHADVAVGAIEQLAWAVGHVRVFSGRTGAELMRLSTGVYGDQLGWSVAGGGDVDGDGRPDLIAGAPGRRTVQYNAGAIVVYSGRDGSVLHTIDGAQQFHRLGAAVAIVGDLDRDGLADFAAGAESFGYFRVWSGATGIELARISGAGWLGTELGAGGDVDRDGMPDIVAGAPLAFGEAGELRVIGFGPRGLTGGPTTLSASAGGRQDWQLDAGPAFSQRNYVVAGSLSGIAPGVPLGAVTLPLNLDSYLEASVASANAPPFVRSLGALDVNGTATAAFVLPAGAAPALVGLTLDHAFVLLPDGAGTFDFASNPVPMRIVR